MLIIHAGIASIGDYAFANCGFTYVAIQRTTPPTAGSYIFGTFSSNLYISVPVGSANVNAYKAAANWNYYADLIHG
jgi:hypothetical protein